MSANQKFYCNYSEQRYKQVHEQPIMKTFILLTTALVACSALTAPPITGTTPPAVDCPNSMCSGKSDGNYAYSGNHNYFLQCAGGNAYCQACWPLSLEFSPRCNQCLYSKNDECITTKPWEPATTYNCPDICSKYGPDYSGNIADPSQPRQYVGCWLGVTVGCIACPGNLMFNEKENACLYEGKYITEPSKH